MKNIETWDVIDNNIIFMAVDLNSDTLVTRKLYG